MQPADELKGRTKKFGLRVIKLFQALPRTEEARILGQQLLLRDVGSRELSRGLPITFRSRIRSPNWGSRRRN